MFAVLVRSCRCAPAAGLLLALFFASGPARADDFLHRTADDLHPRERAALARLLNQLADARPEERNAAVRRLAAVGRTAMRPDKQRVVLR